MKKAILFVLIINFTLFAQNYKNSIEGNIVEEGSHEPLAGVNVYFSETTIGNMSDAEGNYIIKNIKPGYYDLVVSCIGFEANNYRLEIKKGQRIKIDFAMKTKEYSFGEAIVKTESPDEWLQRFEIFLTTFLGETEYSEMCELENFERLNFEDTDEGFKAIAQEPLLISNQALGYNVYIELLHYDYSYDSILWNYEIKPRFYDLDSNAIGIHHYNRTNAYQGSEREFWNNYDSLFTESSNYKLGISNHSNIGSNQTYAPVRNHLGILADKNPSNITPEYSEKIPRELEFDKIVVQYRPSFFDSRESILTLNHAKINLDESGYPKEEYPYKVKGYWATLGVANMLPRDYKGTSAKRDKILQEELDKTKPSQNTLRKAFDITDPSK